MQRRTFLRALTAGTVVVALGGGAYVLADSEDERRARATLRPDGRPRLPPGQYLLKRLRAHGRRRGRPEPGRLAPRRSTARSRTPSRSTSPGSRRCRRSSRRATSTASPAGRVLDARWTGVRRRRPGEAREGASRRRITSSSRRPTATRNVRLARGPGARRRSSRTGSTATPLPRRTAPPVRALVPDLYFWKSAKWLTGVRFVAPRTSPATGRRAATTTTPIPGRKSGMADGGAKRRGRFPWRPWLRAIHRDVGYLAVGLTFVYALSGLAVNHIADWDPNFTNYDDDARAAAGPLPGRRRGGQGARARALGIDGDAARRLPRRPTSSRSSSTSARCT